MSEPQKVDGVIYVAVSDTGPINGCRFCVFDSRGDSGEECQSVSNGCAEGGFHWEAKIEETKHV